MWISLKILLKNFKNEFSFKQQKIQDLSNLQQNLRIYHFTKEDLSIWQFNHTFHMNKYTLTFKDNQMELQYRQFKTTSLQFPTLTYITFGGTVLLIINLLVHLLNENFRNALNNGIVTLVLLFFWIWMKKQIKNRNYCNTILLIINFTFLIFEVDIKNTKMQTFYDGYLFGSNQQLVHTIMMFANTLSYGVMSNLGLTIAKLVIYQKFQGNLYASQYIYTIVVSLSFILIQFANEKQSRCSFASSLRESRWEKMIPILLKKPFILFSFDNDTNNYQLLSSSQLSYFQSETPISSLLYNSVTNQGQQFSTYIKNMDRESQCLEGSCLYNHNLEIVYLQKRITISLIAWHFEKLVYAVIIESEDPMIKEQYQVFKRKIKKCQELLTLQIIPINRVLGVCLSEVFHPLIRNLRISLIEIFYQQSTFSDDLKLVSIKRLLNKCIKLLSSPQNYITVVCDDDLKFVTLRQALILFIFEILKGVNPNESIYIEVTKQERVALQISGLKFLPQTKLFRESRDTLIDKTIRFQESFIFFFVAKPKLAFTSLQSNFQM